MYTFTHSVQTSAAPDAVWALYRDVANWPDWDTGLSAVTIDGPFAEGTTGDLTAIGQPPVPFTLTQVDEPFGFSDVTEIPGVAVLAFAHRIEPRPDGCVITHEVTITGPAAGQLGPNVTADVPEAMAALARLAERPAS